MLRKKLPEAVLAEYCKEIDTRFRIWVDNIEELRQVSASLDYRIRNTAFRDEVLRLLTQMFCTLSDCEYRSLMISCHRLFLRKVADIQYSQSQQS